MGELERLYDSLGQRFGQFPEEKAVVLVYRDSVFQAMTGTPTWAGGFFDGRLHEHAGSRSAVLAHEYTHLLVHRLSAGRAPAWLVEGLAQLLEGRVPSGSLHGLPREGLLPLHTLRGSFLGLSRRSATVAYAESYRATRHLVERFGFERTRHLLEQLRAKLPFAQAFDRVYGEPYRVFEREWLRYEGRS